MRFMKVPTWYYDLITNELVDTLPRPLRDVFVALCVVSYYAMILSVWLSGLWLLIGLWGRYHPKSWYRVFGRYWQMEDYGPDGNLRRIEPDEKPRWTWFETVLVIVYLPILLLLLFSWIMSRVHPH